MRRTLVYAVLLGLLTGAAAGVALLGLPVAPADAGVEPDGGGLQAMLLGRWGLGLADATLVAIGLLAALLLAVAALDLGRLARARR